MWVKRTEQEVEEIRVRSQIRAKRQRICVSVLIGLVVFLCTAFFFVRWRSSPYPARPVPLYEVPARAPLAAVCGILAGLICYRTTKEPPRKTMICPRCEKTKRDDGVMECSCGGHFEDLAAMKWV